MTTSRMYSLVSFAAALAITLTVGACTSASGRAPLALDAAAPADGLPLTVRFDNDARDYVHVYLVGEKREWLLGRVEPGARVTLRIPDDAAFEKGASIQLAVAVAGHVSLRAAREAPAAITILQPTNAILSQRWTYSQTLATGRLTSLPVARVRAGAGRL